MNKYVLKENVNFEMVGDELMIVDTNTGFTASGNKHSYRIFSLLKAPRTEEEIIELLKTQYDKSQYPRIMKSIPKVIEWADARHLIEIIR